MSRSALLAVSIALTACAVQRTQTPADDHSAHMNPAAAATAALGTPGIPPSAATAEARLKASPRHGEWVKIAWEPGSRDSLMAWVVYPVTRTKAPVVVVVHEIYGLSTWVRGVADQVAADGFIAIAPDFLSRARGGPSSDELASDSATRLIRGVGGAERNRAINAAASYAMMLPSAEQRYAVIGYCWGGQTTFLHAVNGGVRGFSAGVAFYGAPPTGGGRPATASTPAVPATLLADSLAKVNVPLMLLNGSKDTRIGAMMPAMDSLMKALRKNYSGTNYDGAIHGFLRAQDDPREPRASEDSTVVMAERRANLAAAKDAWPRTIAFLRQHLR